MDDIDREWREVDLADLIEGYEAADQAEYAEFMGDLLDDRPRKEPHADR